MLLLDLVNRVKDRTHRGNRNVTNDAITQQIVDAINDSRREVIRLLPKQWLRTTTQFNTVPATLAGGASYGTLTSASSPSVVALNFYHFGQPGQLSISINGEAFQTITLDPTVFGGANIAQMIQNAVQALIAASTYNQVAYNSFTCTFTGGLYVCTSGTWGSQSSVVINSVVQSGITDAAYYYKLTAATGATAVQGTGAAQLNSLPVPLYDLPADCQEPVLFRYQYNGADYFITKVESEREFYQNVFGTTVAPNKPLYFFDAGINPSTNRRQIYLWPISDIVYTIFLTYMMDPTLVDLMVSDLNTQIPVFPSYIQDCLWKGARSHFLNNFDDPNRASALTDYTKALLDVETADERDLDSDLQFRMDVGRRITDFRSPGTGIRLK